MAKTPDILIPQRPPKNTIELGGKKAPADYFLFAWASEEPHKATYDLLIDDC